MATLNLENLSEVVEILGEPESEEFHDEAPQPRRQSRLKRLVVGALLVLALTGAAAATFTQLTSGPNAGSAGSLTTHTVARGDMPIIVTEQGSLESTVDVKCMVAGGTTIVWVIPDGSIVPEGTEILRLDTSKLEEDCNRQNIAWEKAKASNIQAEKDLATAEIALEEYRDGTFKKDLSDAESKVTVAEGNLRSAESALQYGERMFRKGYITALMLDAQRAAVERGKLDLGTAQIAKEVLEKFTRAKMIQDLESKRDAAKAKREAEKASLVLEESKLKRLTTQLGNCIVKTTKPGLVIYNNERARWNPDQEVKVGMKAWEGITILRLPDLNSMRVKTLVHESKVDQIHQGMRARIKILEREFQGSVASVGNRPEQDLFNATLKKFAVNVNFDGTPEDLRPGMTAEVEILVTNLENVISLPVAAVAEKRGQNYCCVKKGEELERRNVVLGQGNDKFVEIKEGLEVDEEVVFNPAAALGEITEDAKKQPEVDIKKKFGTGDAKSKTDQKQPSADAKGNSSGDAKAPAAQNAPGKAADKTDGKSNDKLETKSDAKSAGG